MRCCLYASNLLQYIVLMIHICWLDWTDCSALLRLWRSLFALCVRSAVYQAFYRHSPITNTIGIYDLLFSRNLVDAKEDNKLATNKIKTQTSLDRKLGVINFSIMPGALSRSYIAQLYTVNTVKLIWSIGKRFCQCGAAPVSVTGASVSASSADSFSASCIGHTPARCNFSCDAECMPLRTTIAMLSVVYGDAMRFELC